MKNAIKEVLREFYRDGVPETVVGRDVRYYEKATLATVIKGMRRTGKTYVTYARIQELLAKGVELGRIIHLNFEDDRLRGMTADQLRLIEEAHAELYPEFSRAKRWFFLDELQDVPGWERYARRLVDAPRVQLCLTGSSSKLLSVEIATEMRGRAVPIEVFPLSFREFLRFNDIMEEPPPLDALTAAERGTLRHALERYANVGGFPAVQDMPDAVRVATLQDYAHAVVYRDVLQRHKVVSVQSLLYTLDYLLHNYARRTSAHAISGVLKNLAFPSRREDVADYLSYFRDAYIVYPVSVLSDSLAVRRVNPDKHYAIDVGLVNAVTTKTDAEKGWKLENLVYMALRRGQNQVNYLPLAGDSEVDFHVFDHVTGKRRLIQVAYEMSAKETFGREMAALREARKTTGIDDCTVVTWDDERTTEDGIRIVPAWKWLLAEAAS